MNVDVSAKQPIEVQHLAEVQVKNVQRTHHYNIASKDNLMSSSLFGLMLLLLMVQM